MSLTSACPGRAARTTALGRGCLALGLATWLTLAIACADDSSRRHDAASGGPVTGLSIDLPPSLEMERSAYESDVLGAIAEVADFFSTAGFGLPAQRILDAVLVFDSTQAAREFLAKEFGIPLDAIPETFAGTVVENRLFLVSRESYRQIWQQLYPEWPWTDRTYRSLMIHEVAHRMHEALVQDLCGSSDAMGPVWFFEGLAVACAMQFEEPETPLSREELRELVGSGPSLTVSYPLYGRIFRALAEEFGVQRLVSEAAHPDFPDVLWSAQQ